MRRALDLLVGTTAGWLGQSLYLREICGREEGAPPPVDLDAERRHGEFVRQLIREGRVSAAHDLSDGGLAIGLAEMAMAGNLGAQLVEPAPDGLPLHAFLFGEDQGRYLVTAPLEAAEAIARDGEQRGIPVRPIGLTGGATLTLAQEPPILVADLRLAHETWLPSFMASPG